MIYWLGLGSAAISSSLCGSSCSPASPAFSCAAHGPAPKPTTIIQSPWKEAWVLGKRTARDLIGDKADAREVERRGLVAEEVLHGAVLFQEVRKVDERRGLGVERGQQRVAVLLRHLHTHSQRHRLSSARCKARALGAVGAPSGAKDFKARAGIFF